MIYLNTGLLSCWWFCVTVFKHRGFCCNHMLRCNIYLSYSKSTSLASLIKEKPSLYCYLLVFSQHSEHIHWLGCSYIAHIISCYHIKSPCVKMTVFQYANYRLVSKSWSFGKMNKINILQRLVRALFITFLHEIVNVIFHFAERSSGIMRSEFQMRDQLSVGCVETDRASAIY